MNRSMITAAVSMGQLQQKLDTIGNNLANVNTNGFKKRDARFSDLLAQQFNNQPLEREEVGRLTANGIRQGTGAKVTETALRLQLGSFQQTDRELDLALSNPNHFFQIQTFDNNGNERIQYSRDGAFYLSPTEDGQVSLVTSKGDFLLGQDGPITFADDAKQITINDRGLVIVTNGKNETQTVGQLELVEVIRPQLLLNQGDNLYGLPNLDELNVFEEDILREVAATDAAVKQGALESSNVDLSAEMTELLIAQRSYQFNAKSISIADQMMGLVNGLR